MLGDGSRAFADVLAKAASPLDVAVVLAAGVLGYSVDGIFDLVVVFEPGVVGILSMGGALSVKKTCEGWLSVAQKKKRLKKLLLGSNNLQALFEKNGRKDLSDNIARLLDTRDFFEDEEFCSKVLDLLTEYHQGEQIDEG